MRPFLDPPRGASCANNLFDAVVDAERNERVVLADDRATPWIRWRAVSAVVLHVFSVYRLPEQRHAHRLALFVSGSSRESA